jgi:trehalose-6-phosphatase
VYSRLLLSDSTPEFIMAAGDDVTDEDLFARVPDSAWTIHVGRNQSKAKHYLPGPDEMVSLLTDLADRLCSSPELLSEILSAPERGIVTDVVTAEPLGVITH